jgi:hypothetical protein
MNQEKRGKSFKNSYSFSSVEGVRGNKMPEVKEQRYDEKKGVTGSYEERAEGIINQITLKLGIERLFSDDGKFKRKDGSSVEPEPVAGGLSCITTRIYSLDGFLPMGRFGEILNDKSIEKARKNVAEFNANAGEIICSSQGWSSGGNYPIQLYRI